MNFLKVLVSKEISIFLILFKYFKIKDHED